MKFCFFTDVHWCQNSSIVRSRGTRYSTRLENLIDSVNWVENLSLQTGCDFVVCGGDFFDSIQLNSEEISSLKEIKWNGLPHYFIIGNHEASNSSLEFSTLDVFSLCQNSIVYSKPDCLIFSGVEICFLPFITERNRQPLETYFPAYNTQSKKRIIISHNDLKDVQYGRFLSTEGFTLEEIDKNCDLFLNGHIHHCQWVNDKVLNGGNLTGQNFTEDYLKDKHCVQIIDSDAMTIDFYENPFALNFMKISVQNSKQLDDLISKLICKNIVITATVPEELVSYTKECLDKISVSYRVLVDSSNVKQLTTSAQAEFKGIDHLQQFKEYVKENFGDSKICNEELQEILR